MKRPEKEAVVAQLTDKFREADAIYLTEYRGLTVPQISELREKLGRDTSYTVAKNTLIRIAAKEAGIEGLDEILAGPYIYRSLKSSTCTWLKKNILCFKKISHIIIQFSIPNGKFTTEQILHNSPNES